jgi:hypothetical protein
MVRVKRMVEHSIIVNTFPSRSTPWMVKFMGDRYWPIKNFLEHVKELPENFEALPKNYWGPSSLPRYYLLIKDLGSFSVIGVKYNLERTNWFIRVEFTITEGTKIASHGWYHPDIKKILVNTLEDVLKKLPTDIDLLISCILEERKYPCNPVFKTR